MSIGENIKKLRKNIGLSQVQLAEKLDTTQKVITDYETGRSKPPRKRLPKIANFFGITIESVNSFLFSTWIAKAIKASKTATR